MSSSLKIWLQAFRLRTLPLAFSSTFLGSFLAYYLGDFRWIIFVLATLTTLFLQILSNLANDYGDARKGTDNVERLGPQRVTQTGLVSHTAIKRMIVVFVMLSFVSGSALILIGLNHLPIAITTLFFALGLSAIFAAIKYTIGKNPYGYIGLGDVFVYLFFGLVGVGGTFYLHAASFDLWVLLPASTIGMLSAGVLNLNNMRDIVNDANSGKRTLVVRIGLKAAKIYHVILLVVAVLFSLVYTVVFFQSYVQFLFLVTMPLLYFDIKAVLQNKVPIELNSELKKLALTTFAFSITFGLGLVLS
jgi:1,4-dihydroxy-2-naphthoate octaprenyltransferase